MNGSVLIVFGVFVVGYVLVRAFLIEPRALQITRHTVPVVTMREHNEFHMVQLSDLHLWGYSEHEERIVRTIQAQSPDAVVLTGDYAESPAGFRALEMMLYSLRQAAPVYAVLGDNDMEHARLIEDLCRQCNVQLLRNTACLHWQGDTPIVIAGVDDPNTHHSRPKLVKQRAQDIVQRNTALHELTEVPVVLLAHSPEIALEAAPWMDVIVTGHTHGGQICLPGGYALYTNTQACRGYAAGWYDLNSSSRMYVHRGLGTARIPARLFCRPEIASFYLRRKAQTGNAVPR